MLSMRLRSVKVLFFLFFILLILFVSSFSASASPSLNLHNTLVMTDNIKVLKQKHELIDKDTLQVYIINFEGKIDIVYTQKNGSIIQNVENFAGEIFTLNYVPESHLEIKKNGVIVFSSMLHESNWENYAKYQLGKDAQTPELARTNMLYCFFSAMLLACLFVYKVAVPLFEDIEIKEI